MRFLYTIVGAIFVLFYSGYASADTKSEVATTVSGYWKAFSSSDFDKAAEYVNPTDLTVLQEKLLPVFLDAQNNKNKEIREFTSVFFEGIKPDVRSSMSKKEIFLGVMRIAFHGKKGLFKSFSRSSIEIVDVIFDDSGEKAVADCRIVLEGSRSSLLLRLELVDGKWKLKMPESPDDTVLKLEKLFLQWSAK